MIVVRNVLLYAASLLPASQAHIQWGVEAVVLTLLDHNVCLSVSTAIMGWFHVLLLDGPRSWIVKSMLNLDEGEVEEVFGSKTPSFFEVCFWRLRIPVYLIIRAYVTECWTVDPDILPA